MLCVIAKLPDDATEKLQRLREKTLPREQSTAPLYGHITLAAYLPEDDATFARVCAERLRGLRSFPVLYRGIEALRETSIVVAAPAQTESLLSLHSKLVKGFEGALDCWTGGKNWYPHTTLLYDPAAGLEKVCRAMRRHFVPFETRISRVEVSKAEGTEFTITDAVSLL